jgi:predicted ester cyclase
MDANNPADIYRAYIACLNARTWGQLGDYVAADVSHNARPLGLNGYRAMLEQNCRDIPDLHFSISQMVCEGSVIACRLWFDCSPVGDFLGLPVKGRRVCFAEHVFYEWRGGRIANVWSVLDKMAIERQLAQS